MRRSDFALISALYDSKKGGLYSDVYFPIIKYTIVSLFYQKEQQEYYTQENIREFIIKNFGIEIPSLVIKKSVVAISKKSSDLELEIYDNGAEFKILKAWDFSINEDIDTKAQLFDTYIGQLESEYRKYVENENIESDKTFLDFISDNTDDILGYFENESLEKIDSEYAIMAYFLKHLQKVSPELFKIASELFWGSIIAGFLKREKISVPSGNASSIEYFLDTPIVMGLLNLSTSENEQYSREVLEIIKASGGLPRIHPITMEEVASILTSVENADYPIPNSPIEAAWVRDELSKSKLAKIRVNAKGNLEELGAIHFPPISPQDIIKIKTTYQNKNDVKALAECRGGISSERGIFRDVHDVFMDDYIEERRNVKGADDCCFFVTTNTELIKFCKARKGNLRMRTIGSGRIILELWMHNTKKSGIENNALTEMMARCIDMNNRDVRNKLGIVAKYYNSSKWDDFDPKVVQEIMRCLYKRDKEVIAAVEGLKDDGNNNIDIKMRVIVEKAHQSSMYDAERMSDIQQQIDTLQRQLNATMQEKDAAIETGREEARKTQNLQDLLDRHTETVMKQGETLKLYEEKDRLTIQRDSLKKDLEEMKLEMGKYVKQNDHYKFYLGLEICLLTVFLLSLGFTIYRIIAGKDYTIAAIVAVLSLLISLLTVLTRKSLYIIERKGIHDEIKAKAKQRWLSMNTEYESTRHKMAQIEERLSEIITAISN